MPVIKEGFTRMFHADSTDYFLYHVVFVEKAGSIRYQEVVYCASCVLPTFL